MRRLARELSSSRLTVVLCLVLAAAGIAGVHSILADLNIHLEDMIAEGDLVGVRGTMRCRHVGTFLGVAPTGHELAWKGLAVFRVENGRIAERWFNSDSISILRQLGLAPMPAPGAIDEAPHPATAT